jgi:hypothetical protein
LELDEELESLLRLLCVVFSFEEKVEEMEEGEEEEEGKLCRMTLEGMVKKGSLPIGPQEEN